MGVGCFVCQLHMAFGMCFGAVLTDVGLGEQNVHAAFYLSYSHMYIRSGTEIYKVGLLPVPFPIYNLSFFCPLLTITAAAGLSLHCYKMQTQSFAEKL